MNDSDTGNINLKMIYIVTKIYLERDITLAQTSITDLDIDDENGNIIARR